MAYLRTAIGIGITTFWQVMRSAVLNIPKAIIEEGSTVVYFTTENGIYIVGE